MGVIKILTLEFLQIPFTKSGCDYAKKHEYQNDLHIIVFLLIWIVSYNPLQYEPIYQKIKLYEYFNMVTVYFKCYVPIKIERLPVILCNIKPYPFQQKSELEYHMNNHVTYIYIVRHILTPFTSNTQTSSRSIMSASDLPSKQASVLISVQRTYYR